MKFIFTFIIFLALCTTSLAEPYGPTIAQVAKKYQVTRNFDHLNGCLKVESLPLRLGMTEADVNKIVSKSKTFHIDKKQNSKIYISNSGDKVDAFNTTSLTVSLRKGIVVMIETNQVNNFEGEKEQFAELKGLKQKRIDECWVHQNFVDVNSMANGFDFIFSVYFGIPDETNAEAACMGSDRASVIIGKPGLLYPNHIK